MKAEEARAIATRNTINLTELKAHVMARIEECIQPPNPKFFLDNPLALWPIDDYPNRRTQLALWNALRADGYVVTEVKTFFFGMPYSKVTVSWVPPEDYQA